MPYQITISKNPAMLNLRHPQLTRRGRYSATLQICLPATPEHREGRSCSASGRARLRRVAISQRYGDHEASDTVVNVLQFLLAQESWLIESLSHE